jgi:hypothetical protein
VIVKNPKDYENLMRLLEPIICVLIKSEANEEVKNELIEKLMSLDEAT